jgi:hypothetical protein
METDKRLLSLSPATGTDRNYHAPLKGRAEQAIRMAGTEVARALQETLRVLRIMVSLHSTNDYPTILRLYGLESSPSTE